MSCALGSSLPSGGRRSTKRVPAASVTMNVMLERPPAISLNDSGARISVRSASQAVTRGMSMPSILGAPCSAPCAGRGSVMGNLWIGTGNGRERRNGERTNPAAQARAPPSTPSVARVVKEDAAQAKYTAAPTTSSRS